MRLPGSHGLLQSQENGKALNPWQLIWNGAKCCSKADHKPARCWPTFNFHIFTNYLELFSLLERQVSVLLYNNTLDIAMQDENKVIKTIIYKLV